jgi:hypothetical protein
MKQHNKKKLSLNPETLRTLSPADAANIVGGFAITSLGDVSNSCLCTSGLCSIGAHCDFHTNHAGNTK